MELNEKTINRTDIYNGRIIKVHVDDIELCDGKPAKREVVEHPGGVCVAAVTPKNELLFVRQFRYPYKEVVPELPAGKLEPGEDVFEAVVRELKEETGSVGRDWKFCGNLYPSPGYTNEIIRLWFCYVDEVGTELDLDEDEFLTVEAIPIEEAVRMVMDNEIVDAKTQTLVLKAEKLLKK